MKKVELHYLYFIYFRIVTGLKFVKVNRVIHIQIKEGELLPRGGLNMSSIRWKSVENYSTTDPNVKNDVDYKTLSWEQRAIDLDDLEGEDGHVLTGKCQTEHNI